MQRNESALGNTLLPRADALNGSIDGHHPIARADARAPALRFLPALLGENGLTFLLALFFFAFQFFTALLLVIWLALRGRGLLSGRFSLWRRLGSR